MIAHDACPCAPAGVRWPEGDGSEEVPMAKYLFEVRYTLEGIKGVTKSVTYSPPGS